MACKALVHAAERIVETQLINRNLGHVYRLPKWFPHHWVTLPEKYKFKDLQHDDEPWQESFMNLDPTEVETADAEAEEEPVETAGPIIKEVVEEEVEEIDLLGIEEEEKKVEEKKEENEDIFNLLGNEED